MLLIEPPEDVMSAEELERIKKDLSGLLEANQLDWLQLATQRCPPEVRANIRKSIHQRTRKSALFFGGNGNWKIRSRKIPPKRLSCRRAGRGVSWPTLKSGERAKETVPGGATEAVSGGRVGWVVTTRSDKTDLPDNRSLTVA